MDNNNEEIFTRKYFSQINGIKTQTIDALIESDYDSIHTLLALDLSLDLDRLPNVSMGQKSVLRKALQQLRDEYSSSSSDSSSGNNNTNNTIIALETSSSQTKQVNAFCQICGSNDFTSNKLGLNTCNACYSFVTKCKRNKPQKCVQTNGQKCFINVETRNNCKFCRFQKYVSKLSSINREKEESKSHVKDNDREEESQVQVMSGLCRICGAKASNEMQFGVQCCGGCNTFFRRVYRGEIKIIQCLRSCLINAITRNQCKYCRYQKCLQMGMNGSTIGIKNKKRKKSIKDSENECIFNSQINKDVLDKSYATVTCGFGFNQQKRKKQ